MSDKRKAFEAVLSRLEKLLPHLGDENREEAANALGRINEVLRKAKLDWHDLVTFWKGKHESILDLLGALFAKDADVLIKLALEGASLFHTADGVAFADVQTHGHRETLELKSGGKFEQWLLHQFFRQRKKAPAGGSMKGAIRTLTAHAQFEGEQHEVHLRIAELNGCIYIDLADRESHIVEIDAVGWRIVGNAPVRFRRTPNMRPLPLPQKGGSIAQLRRFVNLDNNSFVLFASILLDALRAARPHPVLYLVGKDGSGKTWITHITRSLADPNKADARSLPTNVEDLFVAVHNAHVQAYDNVSKISDAVSDALCQIASGAGFGRRARYTDSSEFAVSGSRLIILNGIKNVVRRSDLADRVIILNMTRISAEHRRSDTRLKREFEQERGLIFGALLDAVAHGLRELPRVQLKRAPRMVDYAEWGIACETAYAEAGAFLAAFQHGATEATEGVIEQDPVTMVVLAFMVDRVAWRGTATQLYADLMADDPSEQKATRDPAWPKGASRFGTALRGAETILRKAGVELLVGRSEKRNRSRWIDLRRIEIEPTAERSTDGTDSTDTSAPADIREGQVVALRKTPQ